MPTQSIEIHHIGIPGGDATAIKIQYTEGTEVKSKRILLDAGGEQDDLGVRSLLTYLSKYFGTEPFDYAIASHYHADHISGFARCGIVFNRIIDIGGYNLGNTRFSPINDLGNQIRSSNVWAGYANYIERKWLDGGKQEIREALPFVAEQNFEKGVLKPEFAVPFVLNLVPGEVTLTCYCAAGVLADGTNVLRDNVQQRARRKLGVSEEHKDHEDVVKAVEGILPGELQHISPNDLSLAFILQWGEFRYFTAGDLSGDLSMIRYCNIEEPLIEYLRDKLKILGQPITVMKATHHGSNHNNYPAFVERVANYNAPPAGDEEDDEAAEIEKGAKFVYPSKNGKGLLDELQPETIIVPCNQMKGVPGGEYIRRVGEYCNNQNLVPHTKRLATIAFVNECLYPRPKGSYDQKQRAKVEDFQQIKKNLLDISNLSFETEISDSDEDPTIASVWNEAPTVVIVRVPRFDNSWQLPEPADNTKIRLHSHAVTFKKTHSVIVHDDELNAATAKLRPVSVPQLPSIERTMFEYVQANLDERAEELMMLEKDGQMDYLNTNFPALIRPSDAGPTLLSDTSDELKVWFMKQLTICYPPDRSAGTQSFISEYRPIKGVSRNERITLTNLFDHTPRVDDFNVGVRGLRIAQEAQNVQAERRKRKFEEGGALGYTSAELNLNPKRRRTQTQTDKPPK